MELNYIVLIASLFFLVFLLFKEIGRSNKARLKGRVLANSIAISCFALLLIPVKYKSTQLQNTSEIILLTKGATIDSVAELKAHKYALASANLKNPKVKVIPDLSYFLKSNPTIRKLNIYGYGLDAATLKDLTNYQLTFHPAENPSGIVSANWPSKLKTSEQLNVQGIYQNTGKESVKLLLKGFGNTLDSIIVKAKSTQSFSFKDKPKQLGKTSYQLIALQKNDTLSIDPVPFEMMNQAPMKVLILASFPDFEYKFLKKWLYENHYPLAFRSQISKDKYASDFLNMDSLQFDRIDLPTLKKFDLLIIDEEELSAIKANENAAITQAVATGMGILIRISKPKAITRLSDQFSRFEATEARNKQLDLMGTIDHYKFSPLPLAQTLSLRTGTSDQPLITDANGKILVNSSINGYGKVVVSAISATYNWLLSGKKADYTNYWTTLLSKAARKKNEMQSLVTNPQFPVFNQKTRIIVDLPESGKVPSLKIDSVPLSPRQNMEIPFEWDAFYWPEKTGWNELKVNGDTQSFYIYQDTEWQALRTQQLLNYNQAFVKQTQDNPTKNTIKSDNITKEVSKWWFFIGFLCAAGFLWYEARMLG